MWFQGLTDVLLAKCLSSILSLPGPDVPARPEKRGVDSAEGNGVVGLETSDRVCPSALRSSEGGRLGLTSLWGGCLGATDKTVLPGSKPGRDRSSLSSTSLVSV